MGFRGTTAYKQPQGAGAGRGAGRGGRATRALGYDGFKADNVPAGSGGGQLWNLVSKGHEEALAKSPTATLSLSLSPPALPLLPPQHSQNQEATLEYKEVTSYFRNTKPSGTGPGPQYTDSGSGQQVTSYVLNANPPSTLTTHTAHASSSISTIIPKLNLSPLATPALALPKACGSLNEGPPHQQVCASPPDMTCILLLFIFFILNEGPPPPTGLCQFGRL